MIKSKYLGTVALSLIFLIISLPIALAQELNLVYDGNGNLVTGDSFYREYNGLNQLLRIREGNTSSGKVLEEYKWHPVEEKVVIKKVYYNNTLNYTVYYVNENFIQIVNSSGTYNEKYVYQEGILVAQVNTDGQKQFVHNDHLGSTSLITDTGGNVVENSFFEPFGQIIEGGRGSRYDFTSKEFDAVTQDYDFMARRYNPAWGKFIQPDPLLPNVFEPQQLNRYSYVTNNPYKFKDIDGNQRSQADGEYEPGILMKLFAQRTNAQINARIDLYEKLSQEYKESHPEVDQPCISRYGCPSLPSFEELQQEDLKRNLIVIVDKDSSSKTLGYAYRGQLFTSKDYLISKGFDKSAVNREIKEQLRSGGSNVITINQRDLPRYVEKLRQDVQKSLFEKIKQKEKEEKKSKSQVTKIIEKIIKKK